MEMSIFSNEELQLLRTCVRWYANHTEKQILRLEQKFGDNAETLSQKQRLSMLRRLDKIIEFELKE